MQSNLNGIAAFNVGLLGFLASANYKSLQAKRYIYRLACNDLYLKIMFVCRCYYV